MQQQQQEHPSRGNRRVKRGDENKAEVLDAQETANWMAEEEQTPLWSITSPSNVIKEVRRHYHLLERLLVDVLDYCGTRKLNNTVRLQKMTDVSIAYVVSIPKIEDEVFTDWKIISVPYVKSTGTFTIIPRYLPWL